MGQIPYGYRIENGAAVIVPEEAAQIRLIFQNYIAGMSLQSAARAAGHPMVHSTVRRMLQRKCYLGDAFYPAILDKETYARANAEWQHRADVMQRLGKTRRKPVFPQTSFSLELPQQMPELIGNTPFQQAEYLYHLIENKE